MLVMGIAEFEKYLKNKKTIAKKIRLYYVIQQRHYYLNNGKIEQGFQNVNIQDQFPIDRDSLLSVYSRMEFIFDELIRISLIGLFHEEKSKRLLYILSIVPVNRKIRLFLDWKIFDEEFTRMLSRLFEVKNGLLHCVTINEVEYRKKKTLFLSNDNDLNEFLNDLQSAWNSLFKVYKNELKKFNWTAVIEEIKKHPS